MESFYEQHQIYPISTPTPFPIGPVNIYLHKAAPLTLIDAGTNTAEAYESLVCGLRRHGVEVGDIERVILTHHHLDHVGLLGRIMETSGAQSYGHPGIPDQRTINYSYDEGHRRSFRALLEEMGTPEDFIALGMEQWDRYRPLQARYTITSSLENHQKIGPFMAHFVPGHSATDTILVHEEGGYAVTGDHFLEMVAPNPILRRSLDIRTRPKSLVEYRESLKFSRSLPLGVCLPGHGGPIGEHQRIIDSILGQQDRKKARVLQAIRAEGNTPFEVTVRLYPKRIQQEFFLCLSMAVGHLELLEQEGLASSQYRDAVLYFFPVSKSI